MKLNYINSKTNYNKKRGLKENKYIFERMNRKIKIKINLAIEKVI